MITQELSIYLGVSGGKSSSLTTFYFGAKKRSWVGGSSKGLLKMPSLRPWASHSEKRVIFKASFSLSVCNRGNFPPTNMSLGFFFRPQPHFSVVSFTTALRSTCSVWRLSKESSWASMQV